PSFDELYPGIIAALFDRYGRLEDIPRPADSLLALLTALLSRTLEPRSVQKVLEALGDAGLIEPGELARADALYLGELAKLSGTSLPRPVAQTLKRLARWLVEQHTGKAESLEEVPT